MMLAAYAAARLHLNSGIYVVIKALSESALYAYWLFGV